MATLWGMLSLYLFLYALLFEEYLQLPIKLHTYKVCVLKTKTTDPLYSFSILTSLMRNETFSILFSFLYPQLWILYKGCTTEIKRVDFLCCAGNINESQIHCLPMKHLLVEIIKSLYPFI